MLKFIYKKNATVYRFAVAIYTANGFKVRTIHKRQVPLCPKNTKIPQP